MKFFNFNKKKPKENRIIIIQYENYGWGNSCYLDTNIATVINGECILSPAILNIKMPLDRIVRWSYI